MLGGTADPDITLEEVDISTFNGVIFVGGSGASVYFGNKTAHAIAQKANEQNLVIGAICIAPSTLANCGLLKGKKATSFSSEKGNLTEKGALFEDKPVVTDGRFITADGPGAAEEFGKAIVEALK